MPMGAWWKRGFLVMGWFALLWVFSTPVPQVEAEMYNRTCFLGGEYRVLTIPYDSTRPIHEQYEICFNLCRNDSGCWAVTAVRPEPMVDGAMFECRLKNGSFTFRENMDRCISETKPFYFSALDGVDIPGINYERLASGWSNVDDAIKDCRSACQADSECLAFTYISEDAGPGSDGGVCWLKNEVGQMYNRAHYFSGLIFERTVTGTGNSPTEDPGIHIEQLPLDVPYAENVNLPGMDYFNFALHVAEPNFCRTACERDDRCRAYTYVRPPVGGEHGHCWLKDGLPEMVRDTNAISGMIR